MHFLQLSIWPFHGINWQNGWYQSNRIFLMVIKFGKRAVQYLPNKVSFGHSGIEAVLFNETNEIEFTWRHQRPSQPGKYE